MADKKPKRPHPKDRPPQGLEVVYEDRDVIVVNKSAGLLSMTTGRDAGVTAYASLAEWVKRGNPKSRERVYLVHRLDRDVSGVMVFARSEEVKAALQKQWDDADKSYLAFVDAQVDEWSGVIESYLAENSARRVYVTPNPAEGTLARTKWHVVKKVNSGTMLEVKMLTGFRNQIRVQLADAGMPVFGDGKYGVAPKSSKRMALHAWKLAFDHPHTGKRVHFKVDPPSSFHSMSGGIMA
ncbi:RluA family pseudouridine synthase [Sulfuriroseicoccus oceanibius]|uniref:RluA family pseudouridine synthase n=1 Tax=Sulfuriroseicoccus oceanibius TaxID=2707525 RepID=A0A6B3LBN3_9BACT|nr:RluA family pseudouridine synthase [Sulfuriroseicoccus oceanibius]QQL45090.1 RluA family pseudouridine synthase [Sulfuriroseicoccus oceanibius]